MLLSSLNLNLQNGGFNCTTQHEHCIYHMHTSSGALLILQYGSEYKNGITCHCWVVILLQIFFSYYKAFEESNLRSSIYFTDRVSILATFPFFDFRRIQLTFQWKAGVLVQPRSRGLSLPAPKSSWGRGERDPGNEVGVSTEPCRTRERVFHHISKNRE